MTEPRHLVSVWNPSYAADAMEEHLGVLLEHARRYDDGALDEDELYVWWGKVRSHNRQQPMAHADELRALGRALAEREEGELQLYLTDYRSLYVADVDAIHEGELPADERTHVPRYYAAERLSCDFWFRLRDIRRLVADDLLSVVEELKRLRNVHYHDRPVSLYGGMVDLPLVVTRPDGARYFDERERDAMTDGRLWAELDAETGAGAKWMERELRENLLGDGAWSALEPAVRTFVASAEMAFRQHRGDRAFDFGPVVNGFAKGMETQANATLRALLRRLPREVRLANVDGRTVDLLEHGPLALGELARAIGGDRERARALAAGAANGAWFTGQLPPVLDELRAVRNPGAHSDRVDERTATRWRNQILGVGCAGHLVELGRVRAR